MPASPIKKRLFINAGLAVALIALGIALWLAPGDNAEKNPPLTTLKKQAATAMIVERPGRTAIVLKKTNGHWRLIKPLQIAANDFRVGNILNILQAGTHGRYPTATLNLADFGLKPPVATLHVNSLTIAFGRTDPVEEKRYVLIDRTLYLIDDSYLPLLGHNVDALIDTRPLPAHAAITRLETPDFTLTQTGTGGWSISPDTPSLGADALQSRVDQWRKLQAPAVDYRPEATFKNTPRVVLDLKNGKTLQFLVVEDEKDTGLFRPDKQVFYALDKSRLDALLARPRNADTPAPGQ